MVKLDLHYVDELITVRRAQHGGYQGAPPMVGKYREGASINRSCVVMLSAQLQTYVEGVLFNCSRKVLPALHGARLVKYEKAVNRWGNPSADNIKNLFLRIGVESVLDCLSWQKCPDSVVKAKLNALNEIRNDIAHGEDKLMVGGKEVGLNLAQVERYRDFAKAFASRFEAHAKAKAKGQ